MDKNDTNNMDHCHIDQLLIEKATKSAQIEKNTMDMHNSTHSIRFQTILSAVAILCLLTLLAFICIRHEENGNKTHIETDVAKSLILINDISCRMTTQQCVENQQMASWVFDWIKKEDGIRMSYIEFGNEQAELVVNVSDNFDFSDGLSYYNLINSRNHCKYLQKYQNNSNGQLFSAMQLAETQINRIDILPYLEHNIVIFNNCKVNKSEETRICNQQFTEHAYVPYTAFVINSGDHFNYSDEYMVCLTGNNYDTIYNNPSRSKMNYVQNILPHIRRRLRETEAPSQWPTKVPTAIPTTNTANPTASPTTNTANPSVNPTANTVNPTASPTTDSSESVESADSSHSSSDSSMDDIL